MQKISTSLLKKIITPLIIILLIITSLHTTFGSKIILICISKFIPGTIYIKNISGTIATRITLNKLYYKNTGIKLIVQKLSFNIQIKNLNTLIINKLKIKNLSNNYITIKKTKGKIKLLKKKTFIKIKHLQGKINNLELNGQGKITIKYNKFYTKNSLLTTGENILNINKKKTTIKITTPNTLLSTINFSLYYTKYENKFIIQNFKYKKITINYLTGSFNTTCNKSQFKIITHNINITKTSINTCNIKINGNLNNHNLYINSKNKNINLNLHGQKHKTLLSYTIKFLKIYNFYLTNSTTIYLNENLIKIKKLELTKHNTTSKIIFKFLIKYNKQKNLFGNIYIFTTNIKIPELKALEQQIDIYNIYIKGKIHGHTYKPLISTKNSINILLLNTQKLNSNNN